MVFVLVSVLVSITVVISLDVITVCKSRFSAVFSAVVNALWLFINFGEVMDGSFASFLPAQALITTCHSVRSVGPFHGL